MHKIESEIEQARNACEKVGKFEKKMHEGSPMPLYDEEVKYVWALSPVYYGRNDDQIKQLEPVLLLLAKSKVDLGKMVTGERGGQSTLAARLATKLFPKKGGPISWGKIIQSITDAKSSGDDPRIEALIGVMQAIEKKNSPRKGEDQVKYVSLACDVLGDIHRVGTLSPEHSRQINDIIQTCDEAKLEELRCVISQINKDN